MGGSEKRTPGMSAEGQTLRSAAAPKPDIGGKQTPIFRLSSDQVFIEILQYQERKNHDARSAASNEHSGRQ